MTPIQVSRELVLGHEAIKKHLVRLETEGAVRRLSRGLYASATSQPADETDEVDALEVDQTPARVATPQPQRESNVMTWGPDDDFLMDLANRQEERDFTREEFLKFKQQPTFADWKARLRYHYFQPKGTSKASLPF